MISSSVRDDLVLVIVSSVTVVFTEKQRMHHISWTSASQRSLQFPPHLARKSRMSSSTERHTRSWRDSSLASRNGLSILPAGKSRTYLLTTVKHKVLAFISLGGYCLVHQRCLAIWYRATYPGYMSKVHTQMRNMSVSALETELEIPLQRSIRSLCAY